MITVHHTT